MLRYLHVYAILFRNSLIREMSFKANFLMWTLVEILWFLGQVLFIEVLFSHVDRLADWNKWQVVALIGTHQVIAQVFQAFFYINLTHLPELVRTGKLDSLLTVPMDPQFMVSTKQFGPDNLLNTAVGLGMVGYALSKLHVSPTLAQIAVYGMCVALGVTIHYSILFSLSCLCFWINRAQGIVYGYFNLFNIGRYPETVFKGTFRVLFTWIIPVVLVANVPTKILTQRISNFHEVFLSLLAVVLTTGSVFFATRLLWIRALRRYSSASS